jgi:hypothetical protein
MLSCFVTVIQFTIWDKLLAVLVKSSLGHPVEDSDVAVVLVLVSKDFGAASIKSVAQ